MDAIDKINRLLTQKGMSGAELEKKIGVSNSVYSQWNTKATKPSNKSLLKVAAALDVDISEIMADKDEKKPTQQGELTEVQREAMELIKEMSDEQLKVFIATLKAAKNN